MNTIQDQTVSKRIRPGRTRRLVMGPALLIVALGLGCETASDDSVSDAETAGDASPMADASSMVDAEIAIDASSLDDAETTADASPMVDAGPDAEGPNNSCGHRVDPTMVNFGFNVVLDADGTTQRPQGRPLQEGWTLGESPNEIEDHNRREYARIASYMMPIRDALMCDIATLDRNDWLAMTQILTLNNIKIEQNLSGRPPERFYSSEGIYELLRAGENHHPMMKYLEEAELELKCIAFQDFDFINPAGNDHCAIHGLPVGQGLVLP